MKIRRARWIWVVVGISLAVNLLLLTAVLYLKVPAVHNALLPAYRVVRGLPRLLDTSSSITTTTEDSRSLPLAPGEISLSASDDKTVVTVYLAEPSNGSHYVIDLDSGLQIVLNEGEATFSWELHAGGSYKQMNHAVVYEVSADGMETFLGEIELYRVSEEEGEERLRVQREHGWIFIGRCTYTLVGPQQDRCLVRTESQTLSLLTAVERSKIKALFPNLSDNRGADTSTQELVQDLGKLLVYMCENGLRNVSGANNADLYQRSPSDAIRAVQKGRIGVQCQGMRSLFIWVAVSTGWLSIDEIREVDAYRYELIPGIDVNSHAILEVKRPEGGWFAFDPLGEVVFTDDSGMYLSVEQIRCLRENAELSRIRVVKLADFCVSGEVSYYADQEGGYWSGFDFADTDPFNRNYWCYFNRLIIRTLHLPD